jgi:hypothetical protein
VKFPHKNIGFLNIVLVLKTFYVGTSVISRYYANCYNFSLEQIPKLNYLGIRF